MLQQLHPSDELLSIATATQEVATSTDKIENKDCCSNVATSVNPVKFKVNIASPTEYVATYAHPFNTILS